ncbi:sigma-70 family RNA polymerase sigma factor [Sporolituus thermophilus]|uniref:Helix-turn-helix domain-containing protein n=1 Tax=Sporolituus thermophilus DSM 23256 TaxID=1123285 RepID=A0A1G7NZ95_9FIRM|nr:sigma-70 family RNA polymerase sigma factor [Sporolituus thermophilus]SDF79372.1 Helix-turn-helix domain-containing protein [Sporolituus thermophilus DSM 23256]
MELEKLVEKAQAGDAAAFAEVCRRFEGLVKKLAYQPHIRAVAEEARAEGWLALVRAVKTYDPASGVPVAGYIESRVKYAVWNLFKRERRRWQGEQPLAAEGDDAPNLLERLDSGCDVAAAVETKLLAAAALRELACLSERQQQVILATVVAPGRLADVATRLGVSVQAVHSLRRRGLAQLRARLEG